MKEAIASALADRYRIVREAGVGGMATVYLAEDLRHKRQVAIKVLKPELAAAMGTDRFRREIEIAAGLHHPHILPLFDSGTAADSLYYVMPFEEGQTLRERLTDSGPASVPFALRIMREVAGALSHAHAANVVHRDIKPENVLLSGEHALVTDFGIAKALAAGATEDGATALTMAGMSLGTPAYMAPEQVAGDARVDHRADIYSLGILGYELLAGVPPFRGATVQQVLGAHLAQAPAPLSTHRNDVPPELEAIIMRCLAKAPEERWQSAADLVAALEQVDLGGSGARTAMPRRRWPLVAAAVLALAGLGGLAWYQQEGRIGTLIGRDVLAADDLLLVAEFTNRTPDSTLAATVTDAIRIDLQESDVVEVVSQSRMWEGIEQMELVPGAALPDARVRELAERLGAKAFVVGDLAPLGGGYQLTARVVAALDGREALQVRATAATEAGLIGAVDDLARKLRRGIGESLRSVADAPGLAQVTTASLPALRAFTAAQRAEIEGSRPLSNELLGQALRDDSTFASAWHLLGINHLNSNRYQEGMQALGQAMRYREKMPELSRLGLEATYHGARGELDLGEAALRSLTEQFDRGWISYSDHLLMQGRFAEAERAGLTGIDRQPDEPVAYWNTVEAQVAQQRFKAADSTLARMEEALPGNAWTEGIHINSLLARRMYDSTEAWLASLSAEGRQFPLYRCALNLVRGRVNKWRECRPDWALRDPGFILAEARLTGDTVTARRRLEAMRTAGLDSTDTQGWPGLIAATAEMGNVAQARQLAAEWRTATGADRRYQVNRPYVEGAIAMAEGRYADAADHYLEWNGSGHLGADHLHARGFFEAGAALDRMGNVDSALTLYQRSLATPALAGGMDYEHAWYPQVLRRLGELHENHGERQQALDQYERLLKLWEDADPVLAPQVDAVRARVAALSGEQPARSPTNR